MFPVGLIPHRNHIRARLRRLYKRPQLRLRLMREPVADAKRVFFQLHFCLFRVVAAQRAAATIYFWISAAPPPKPKSFSDRPDCQETSRTGRRISRTCAKSVGVGNSFRGGEVASHFVLCSHADQGRRYLRVREAKRQRQIRNVHALRRAERRRFRTGFRQLRRGRMPVGERSAILQQSHSERRRIDNADLFRRQIGKQNIQPRYPKSV